MVIVIIFVPVNWCICRSVMSENGLYTIGMTQFRQMFPPGDIVGIGEDLCVADLRYGSGSLAFVRHPFRFDGYMAVFCISGSLKVLINLKEFEVRERSLFVNIPGNILSVPDTGGCPLEDLHFIVVAMSASYMSTLKFDMDKLFSEGLSLLDNPCIILSDEEKEVAGRYLDLFSHVVKSSLIYKRECVSSLVSSLFYLAGGALEKRIAAAGRSAPCVKGRGVELLEAFIRLVAEYHTSERSIRFYAEKLFLTPKYLARVIRDTSGRTASDWIDSYVLLEARNMLKYSGMTIKEIVAGLNFPDVPSFSRFFRSRTGMTPAQYRKS